MVDKINHGPVIRLVQRHCVTNYLQHGCVDGSKVTYLDYTNQSLEPRRIDVPEDEISQLIKTSPSGSTRHILLRIFRPESLYSLERS
jgi:hypothetical protein